MPTKIEWTNETWNPVTGCTPVSAGCQNCYARRMATRLRGRYGYPKDEPFRVTLHPDRLEKPLHWRKPRMIFVCSMGDLWHPDVPDAFAGDVLNIILRCHYENRGHTFQILTKRPDRLLEWLARAGTREINYMGLPVGRKAGWDRGFPPNLWLGVTAENQETADERIPLLLQTPAAVRFVSIEPMLEPVDISPYLSRLWYCRRCGAETGRGDGRATWDGTGWVHDCPDREAGKARPVCDQKRLDWVIVGAETGPGARIMHQCWAENVRDQCREAGVPFFFKRMSPGIDTPPDLQIREFPEGAKR